MVVLRRVTSTRAPPQKPLHILYSRKVVVGQRPASQALAHLRAALLPTFAWCGVVATTLKVNTNSLIL